MITTDSHVHTKYCNHANGDVREYVKSAEEKKMGYLGFADHLPLPTGFGNPDKGAAIMQEDLPKYLADVKKAWKDSSIQIATGIEADYLPGYEKETEKALKKNGFDFVIGSVHFIEKWNFDYSEAVFNSGLKKFGDADEPYRAYYGLVKKMASSGMFDMVGHLDLIKKFGYQPKKENMETVDEILELAKKNGMAVEVNTSGLDKKVGEMYPSGEILKMCFERDIEITVGSDAHSPLEIGRHFGKVEEALRNAGYTNIVKYSKRKRVQVPL